MRITGIARVVSLGQVPSNLSTPPIYKALAEMLEPFSMPTFSVLE